MSSKYGSWKDKGSVTELGKIHTMGETMVSQVIYDNLAIKNIRILKHLNSIYSRNILKLRWIIKKKKYIRGQNMLLLLVTFIDQLPEKRF